MNHRRKIVFFVSALSILLAFPVAGRTGELSRRTAQRKDKMRKPPGNDKPVTSSVPVGTWGGEHVSMEITERGASVEFDCAHAAIDRKIILGGRGRFDVPGTYVEEHGGPLRENEQLNSYPARFTGQIKGKRMKLTVTHSDTKKIIGTFTLIYGGEPSLVKCR